MGIRVFLGGTCNNSNWRNEIIQLFNGVDYFNPVVDDWTPDCMAIERLEREKCQYCLYTITPKMTGVYSIAEVVEDSIKRPWKTIFCVLESDDGLVFTEGQLKSLREVGEMVVRNGGVYFTNLTAVASYINRKAI